MLAAGVNNGLDVMVAEHTFAVVGQNDTFGGFYRQLKAFHAERGDGGGDGFFAFAVKADDLLLFGHHADFLGGGAVRVFGDAVDVYLFIAQEAF